MRIYLDYNATAPMPPAVRRAMAELMQAPRGNPSSVHAEGRAARDRLERARARVAALLGAQPGELVFTSGGTEADLLGVHGLARAACAAGRPARILTSGIEHPAVTGACRALARDGFAVEALPVDADGVIDAEAVARGCAAGAALLTLQVANHELGTVQDVAALSAIARTHGVPVLADAVQALGKLPLSVGELGASAVAVSAHKIGGPAGCGALWIADRVGLAPPLAGGGQERGRRPGTENLLGAVGFGAAAALARADGEARRAAANAAAAALEAGLRRLDGVRIHGAGGRRAGNTVNAGFDGALGEVVVTALDLAGIAASTGSACTSGTVAPSPVLLATGLPAERAAEAVRFSTGPETTLDEVAAVLEKLPAILSRARQFR